VRGDLASGSEKKPLDPDIAPIAMRLAALDGDRALFDRLVAGFEAAKVPQDIDRILGALGSFRTPELADAALALALSEKVRGTQVFAVGFRVADEGEAGEERLFGWTTANYEALSRKLPPFALGFLPGIAGSCSLDRLARAEVFFSEPSHQVPGTSKQMAKTASKIRACAALREREGKAVRREVGESVASVTALPAPKD
jgi:cytosol alanyl aminopeptidase